VIITKAKAKVNAKDLVSFCWIKIMCPFYVLQNLSLCAIRM